MMIDVFKGDGFSLTNLTKAIIDLQHTPTRIRDLGIFGETGIDTTSVMIEQDAESFTLVPAAPRGAPGKQIGLNKRKVRTLQTTHLPQMVHLMADEVQNLRAFGSQSEPELAMARLRKKLAVARRNMELTIEWQRMGAIKGQVLDADGTTVLLDLWSEFGVTQQEFDMALDSDATKVLQKNAALERMVEDTLGGVMMSGLHVLCSAEFFDGLAFHPAVEDTYRYQQGAAMRGDRRARGVQIGTTTYEEYRGKIGATRFIEAGCAYAIPMGVPDLFGTSYAPAPYMETVNTEGLPYYASLEMMDHNVGVEVQTQSNPIHLCTRPNAIVRLGKNAAALA